MEKTKSFKWTNMLYLLLLLPLMLVFCACGADPTKQLKTTATCDTSGDYAASDKAAYSEVIGEQTAFEADGYRLTLGVSLKSTSGEDPEPVVSEVLYMNAIIKTVKKDESVDYQAALNAKFDFTKILGGDDEDMKLDTTLYYKDGKAYATDKDGKKIWHEYSFASMWDAVSGGGELPMFNNVKSIIQIVQYIGNDVTVTRNGNHFKIVTNSVVEIQGQNIDTGATAYINCDSNGKVTEAQLEFEMSMAPTVKMVYKSTVSAFNDNIVFPDDLNKYVEDKDE